MANLGRFSAADLKKLQKELNKIKESDINRLFEVCAKELAARLLVKVIKRTPVGDYSKEIQVIAKRNSRNHAKGDTYTRRVNPSGKLGGTLRRGWTGGSSLGAKGYADYLPVHHFGGNYVIEIINPVEYAAYVEFGHRTMGHRGWVRGKFMMTISEKEIRTIAPHVLERKINDFLREKFR